MTDKLLSIEVENWSAWLWFLSIVPLIARLAISMFESARTGFAFRDHFCGGVIDCTNPGPGSRKHGDYWTGYVLGVLEMAVYPGLIKAGFYAAIGAWLLLKTVHRHNYSPGMDRGPYNRYLIANAIIVVGAYISARVAF